MKNLFPNTRTYRGGRYSGSKKHIRTEVPCDGCSHCDSKCCTEADCVCVDCPPAGITKRGQLKIIDNKNPGVKFMNNLFKTGTYRGDRYSDILMLGKSCGDKCNRLYLPPRLSRRKREGYQNCMSTCEAAGGLDVLLGGGGGDGGNGGDGNGGSGNGGGGGGNGGGGNGNGEGPDTQTIMIWTGVALLLIALIIGGAIAIKKIRT